MKGITNKGAKWEIRNSLWMIWPFVFFGCFNYIAFFYVSYKVKQKKWFRAAIVYSLLFVMMIISTEAVPADSAASNIIFGIFLVGWIVSIVHAFKIRPEYLLRLEAMDKAGIKKAQLNDLKESISKEYATNVSSRKTKILEEEHQSPSDAKSIQHKVEESVNIVDINVASEQEIAQVPGIGSIFAKKVVTIRDEEGGYQSFDHFSQVLNLKPHLIEKIKPHVMFSEITKTENLRRPEGRMVDF